MVSLTPVNVLLKLIKTALLTSYDLACVIQLHIIFLMQIDPGCHNYYCV